MIQSFPTESRELLEAGLKYIKIGKKRKKQRRYLREILLKTIRNIWPIITTSRALAKFSLHTWEVKVSLLCRRKNWRSPLFNFVSFVSKNQNLPLEKKKIKSTNDVPSGISITICSDRQSAAGRLYIRTLAFSSKYSLTCGYCLNYTWLEQHEWPFNFFGAKQSGKCWINCSSTSTCLCLSMHGYARVMHPPKNP